MISLVLSVTSKLGIGKDGELLVRIPEDLKRFKQLTTLGEKNAIVMGRKTWDSLPRLLPGRTHIVFTRNHSLKKLQTDKSGRKFTEDVYFVNSKSFKKLYNKLGPSFSFTVIGGAEVINYFFNSKDFCPREMYLTQVHKTVPIADTFLDILPECYKLVSYSPKDDYTFLNYKKQNGNFKTDENVYLGTLSKILTNGKQRSDRTGTGVYSLFGEQLRFNIEDSFPLLTTKNVPFKSVISELLWFLRGDTDSKILERQSVNIWKDNTSRDFLDSRGLCDYPEGTLGPGYGWSMRYYNAPYNVEYSDTSKSAPTGGTDQIQYVIDLLKTDPLSRRIYMNYWNPSVLNQTALVPCHVSFQFYAEQENGEWYLSGHLYQRSMDTFLGAPWNIASYALLLYIIALKCDMRPRELVISTGDTHVYSNHVEQVREQLSRSPRPFPKVLLDQSIKTKDFKDITTGDFKLLGYFPHPKITAKMAV